MASFLRSSSPPRREWSVADAALFAARKEFELLKLLSTDKKAPWRWRVVSASSSARSRCSRKRSLLQHMRVMLLLRSRPALLTTRRQLRQRRLNVFVVDLHVACSPPQGHTLSRKRTHLQPLRAAMRLHFPIELLGGRWYKMEPLRVRTRGSAAAPRAGRSAQRHAARRRPMRTAAIAVLFLLKLRRRAR